MTVTAHLTGIQSATPDSGNTGKKPVTLACRGSCNLYTESAIPSSGDIADTLTENDRWEHEQNHVIEWLKWVLIAL